MERMKNKFGSLSKRNKLLVGGVGIGLPVILLLFAITAISSTNAANASAKAYSDDVDAYVKSLADTDESIVELKPLVTKAPELEPVAIDWFSEDYKKAEAKQAIVKIHQDEVLNKISSYGDNSYLTDLTLARSTFNRQYNLTLPESTSESSSSVPVDVKFERNSALRQSESRTDFTYKGFKDEIEKIETDAYTEPAKRYTLSQIDAALELEKKYKTAIEKADTFAEIRSLNKQHAVELRFPKYDPNYGAAAMFGFRQLPYLLASPAIGSLEYALENVDTTDQNEAKLIGYTTLYGYTAAYNTPNPQVRQTAANLQKLGVANYALDRLSTKLSELPESDSVEAVQNTLSSVTKSFASLPYGSKSNDAPSAKYRVGTMYEIVTETSALDGYSDMIAALRGSKLLPNDIPGAKMDFDAYDKLRNFAKASYPTSLAENEVKAYIAAADRCIDVRLTYHRKGAEVIEKQIDTAQKVTRLSKEVREIQRSNNRDTDRLREIQKSVREANAELTTLQDSLKPAEAEQTKGISDCKDDLQSTYKAVIEKTDDLPELHKAANMQTRDMYQDLIKKD